VVTHDTRQPEYTVRLQHRGAAWWKRLLDVQAPYRWHVRRLQPGFTLDIGCGLGRHLTHLGGEGVGIDHNPHSVAAARAGGLRVFTAEEFRQTPFNVPGRFDSLLLSHVLEHMKPSEAVGLLREHLPLLKAGGRVILICPQEAGYRSDPSHVQFLDFGALRVVETEAGLEHMTEYSFPFPRWMGRLFCHNEFVSIGRKS